MLKIDVINVQLRGAIVPGGEISTWIDEAKVDHLPRHGELIVWRDQAFFVTGVQHDFDQQIVRVIAERER